MAQNSGVEHSVPIPGDGGAGNGEVTTPERRLNCFVRCVALIERLGNALGTLAFTWATVVLLGGYPSVLHHKDFSFATAIVFLEAARMFSRNNRTDYQLFFGTRGAFRSLGWNWLIVLAYFNGVACMIDRTSSHLTSEEIVLSLATLLAIGHFVCPGAPSLLARIPLWRGISLWSPMVAIVLLAPSVLPANHHFKYHGTDTVGKVNPVATRTMSAVYIVLLVTMLLVTVSRMRFPSIIKLADRVLGGKQEFWHLVVLNFSMIGAIVIATFSLSHSNPDWVLEMIVMDASTLVLVSLGNFQIPAAIARVVLPLTCRIQQYHVDTNNDPSMKNLVPTLYIFCGMVLGQGVLYLMACVVEIFSFIPRRSLVHLGGFKGQWGVDSVDLYYSYALEKCMERNVLSPKISLCSFAMDYLNSDSTRRQLHGIRTAHTLLQRETARTRLLVKLKASAETMTTLMRMLHWTGRDREDETIRPFSAKVIDELAKSLLVVNSPGILQNVSLLLDCGNQHKRVHPLLDTDEEEEQQNDLFVNSTGDRTERGDEVLDTGKLLETQEHSTQQICNSNEHNFWIVRWWRQVSEFWSVPQEEPLTEQDLLPVIGMSIIENLATYDQSNCEEISKATNLIRKITRFTNFCTSDDKYTETEKKVLVQASLKVFYRLTSMDWEIGITLRQKISKHPLLLRNLSEILGDITSHYETKKLAAGILRNLAIDASMGQEIGRVQRTITRLMHAFLSPDEHSSCRDACVSHSREALRKVAGQALAMLAMGNVDNCLAMLKQTGYSFIEELTTMIHVGRYRCVAASLLRSVCMHIRRELKETDLKQLSYISRMVLERILCVEGEELEIFIGLSSRIYEAIPEAFDLDFEYGHIKERFVKRLVDVLNANMEPIANCPGIRRVILEQAIRLMEHDSCYVYCFRNLRMIEVLWRVEETISEAENCTIFMGDVGLMEAGEPLSSLVARAKQLLDARLLNMTAIKDICMRSSVCGDAM